MTAVYLTAFCVGGATMLGTLLGFWCRHISNRFSDLILAFASGVMLSAAILGLILPAAACGKLCIIISGIFSGAACISLLNRLVPRMHRPAGTDTISHSSRDIDRVILFVWAIAIHNFPEGLASGVAFGTGDLRGAFLIAGGIALQNIPEGMVTVTPLLAAGIPPGKALFCGILTGVIEILGTLAGYYAITLISTILPFTLAFAGGSMLYVIIEEMIPQTQSDGDTQLASYALLAGFCLMLASDILLG